MTPMEPTSPLGVTTISDAPEMAQYAADAAMALTCAVMGLRAAPARISAASSVTPATVPPGELTSNRMDPTFGSASACFSMAVTRSVETPPDISDMPPIRCAMTPCRGITATAPERETSARDPPSPIRACSSSAVNFPPPMWNSRMASISSSFVGRIAHGVSATYLAMC